MKLSIKSPEIAREILKQGQNNSYTENRKNKKIPILSLEVRV